MLSPYNSPFVLYMYTISIKDEIFYYSENIKHDLTPNVIEYKQTCYTHVTETCCECDMKDRS